MYKEKLVIAITQGDPAGVGPEICLKAINSERVRSICYPVIIGDEAVLKQNAALLGLPLPKSCSPVNLLKLKNSWSQTPPGLIDLGEIKDAINPGKLAARNGEASYSYIIEAIKGTQGSLFDAMTTAPINKAALHLAGIDEDGHTEILGRITKSDDFAMMMYSPRLTVSFATTHQSLASVPKTLTPERILKVAALLSEALRNINGVQPNLAVLGLNPHAGENGAFGEEEIEIIAPAVKRGQLEGLNLSGPLPPDTAFRAENLQKYAGFITLYHDQGCIPFKMTSFHDGVNVTLGLPIVRTSVDHGTAYDIAWQGKADHQNLISAIELAAKLAANKNSTRRQT